MKSKSKNGTSSIRVFGQRSIASTFRFLQPNLSHRHESQENVRNQDSRSKNMSLSDFLNRKLHKSSPISHTVPGKPTPFQSPLGLSTPKATGEQIETVKQVEEGRNNGSDKLIFERFKKSDDEKGDFVDPLVVDELENAVAGDIQESRKRKNPFAGGNENQTIRKHVVVLGGESKLKQKGHTEKEFNKKPKPLYNHYANGRGWWNDDMEGVDNEELGFNEVWEGVGSTTLGGIADWH
ncbi:hypothetical protein Lal_00021582 [Lupinus albus]|uniref:Uncharacterized protein n=1 Tax=Lupinus albus TaxID=3870 RepID=A0A6A4NT90_LUPAL|nr:hypothetical protein Lalb_Chr21g0312631 [Lupinus albus]KAF1860538.1 hypothetical protein Lal_00021582 [Lupinus albus]